MLFLLVTDGAIREGDAPSTTNEGEVTSTTHEGELVNLIGN